MRASWRETGGTTEVRVMAVGRRMYQLIVTGPDRTFDAQSSARFLGSFRLANPGDERRRAHAQRFEQATRYDDAATALDATIKRASEASNVPTWLEPAGRGFRAWMPAGIESSI